MIENFLQNSHVIIPVTVFIIAVAAIIFDILDKAFVAMAGSVILILTGVLDFETAVKSVDYEILALLGGMMIIIEIAREAKLFELVSFKIAKYSKGNPFLIFLFFTITTGVVSCFLDDVAVILIVVPITITLVRGLGYDPFVFILGEIMFASIGGAITLVGDPLNILVGTTAGFTFNGFIYRMAIPVLASTTFVLIALYIVKWKELKPINTNLPKLFLSNIIIKKIEYEDKQSNVSKSFVLKVVFALLVTLLGFIFQSTLNIPLSIIALTGALILMAMVHKKVDLEHVIGSIEWSTLVFFAGLFIIVQGVQISGVLDLLSAYIVNLTDNINVLILVILWGTATLSTVIYNIPLASIMIPVIFSLTGHFAGDPHAEILWWAFILGAVFGGNATMIGSSPNVVGTSIAKKAGVPITFLSYLRYSLPLTIGVLIISTIYLLTWSIYF